MAAWIWKFRLALILRWCQFFVNIKKLKCQQLSGQKEISKIWFFQFFISNNPKNKQNIMWQWNQHFYSNLWFKSLNRATILSTKKIVVTNVVSVISKSRNRVKNEVFGTFLVKSIKKGKKGAVRFMLLWLFGILGA